MTANTDINGLRHLLHPNAIARIDEPGVSGKWHGIQAYVRLFDKTTIEAREAVLEIALAIDAARAQTKETTHDN